MKLCHLEHCLFLKQSMGVELVADFGVKGGKGLRILPRQHHLTGVYPVGDGIHRVFVLQEISPVVNERATGREAHPAIAYLGRQVGATEKSAVRWVETGREHSSTALARP